MCLLLKRPVGDRIPLSRGAILTGRRHLLQAGNRTGSLSPGKCRDKRERAEAEDDQIGRPIGLKKPESAVPTPARQRVANPRQGDFAKPDCGNLGGRPASRLRHQHASGPISSNSDIIARHALTTARLACPLGRLSGRSRASWRTAFGTEDRLVRRRICREGPPRSRPSSCDKRYRISRQAALLPPERCRLIGATPLDHAIAASVLSRLEPRELPRPHRSAFLRAQRAGLPIAACRAAWQRRARDLAVRAVFLAGVRAPASARDRSV